MKAGIDLGTTYSLIAQLRPDGRPMAIPDLHFPEDYATPSAIYLTEGGALAGIAAESKLEQSPNASIIRFFKRNFGDTQPLAYSPEGQAWHAEALGALILKKLRFDAESMAGASLEGAVITVPAHFNDRQRKAVLYAASMANIKLLGLVDEPVAAALHYGWQTADRDGKLIFVYDFGGGTFDATVLTINAQGVYVLAKDGDGALGGKEFDEILMAFIADQLKPSLPLNFDWSAYHLLLLRKAAEKIKIALSEPRNAFLRQTILLGQWHKEIVFDRTWFEARIMDNILKTIAISQRCIREAGLEPSDIDAFLLVGGSSMIPVIQHTLAQELGVSPERIQHHLPLRAVAHGAALHAAQLSGEALNYHLPSEFRGVTGYYIGIRTINPRDGKVQIDTLIHKNLPLPCQASRVYYSRSDHQDRIVLELVQYHNDPQSAISIGHMDIGPIPFPHANYAVEVKVENTTDGTVRVKAHDPQTGQELEQHFTNRPEESIFMLQQQELVRRTPVNNMG